MEHGIGSGRMRPFGRRATVLLAAAAIGLGTFGCYGSFPLTRTLHKFNGQITDWPIVHTTVFWAFLIVPVYETSVLVDTFILNVIEFWTGEELRPGTSAAYRGGYSLSLEQTDQPDRAVLVVSEGDQVVAREHLLRVSDDVMELRSPDGGLDGRIVRTAAGDIEIRDAAGNPLRTLPAQLLAEARR